jgi:hypothetical protein
MSQENMERTRAVIEDFISGKGEFDTEGMLTKMPDEVFFDPEIEWDASEVPVLDIRGVYRGIEAVRNTGESGSPPGKSSTSSSSWWTPGSA